jgi:hypothetical protein
MEWNSQSRYDTPGKQQAEDLFEAVADRRQAVLRIRGQW